MTLLRVPFLKSRFLFPLLATVLVISWSSGFVGIRFATEDAPVVLVLLWRNLAAAIILLPFALSIGPRITREALVHQMLFGLVGMFFYLASFALAISYHVPTGLVALISDLVPLAIAALSQPLLGLALTKRQWIGTAFGILGVVIVSADSVSLGHAPFFAYILPVIGMVMFAGLTVIQKRLKSVHMPIHQSLAIQCLTAAIAFAIVRAFDGGLMPPRSLHFAFGIMWLVLIATFLCYSVYYYLLRHHAPALVSSAVYLSPPVTMLWAWAMFNEPLTLAMLIGLGVTFFGVYLVTAAKLPLAVA